MHRALYEKEDQAGHGCINVRQMFSQIISLGNLNLELLHDPPFTKCYALKAYVLM